MASGTDSSCKDGRNRSIRTYLMGCAAVLALAAAYWPTVASVEATWRRSETFTHGYLVLPIVLWLIWRRRSAIAAVQAAPFWPALVAMAAGGLGWLLGTLADVLVLEQLSLYVMLIAAVVAVLGVTIAREIVFPLAFLVFAVPFGDFLVPTLIDRTADFTVAALQLSGVPVFREGNLLIIPSGHWSVVDACSGVRYLIASVMVGTLYAHLCYRSARKRLIFFIASIAVPIVANWLRAYMIVMLGHLTNNRLATGVDHFIYGWVFFGAVMTAMFWVGSYWRDADAGGMPGVRNPPAPARRAVPVSAIALLAVVAGIAWRPVAGIMDTQTLGASRPLAAIQAAAGWQPAASTPPVWTPHFTGARSLIHQWFIKDGGRVGVYVALYGGQTQGRELVESGNRLVVPEDKLWREIGTGRQRTRWENEQVLVRTADIAGPGVELEARTWYWVDGRFTSSDVIAKASLAVARLAQRPDSSAVIVVYTWRTGRDGRDARRLDQFQDDMGAGVMQALHNARG